MNAYRISATYPPYGPQPLLMVTVTNDSAKAVAEYVQKIGFVVKRVSMAVAGDLEERQQPAAMLKELQKAIRERVKAEAEKQRFVEELRIRAEEEQARRDEAARRASSTTGNCI
jgi:hypothetical protein